MNKQKDQPEHTILDRAKKKRHYSSPRVLFFGSAANLTKGGGGSITDGGGMPHTMSDRRAKENIHRVGTHWSGAGLYLFDYKPVWRAKFGRGRQFGVMADEIESVLPAAISLGRDGYKRVNYSMLGLSARA